MEVERPATTLNRTLKIWKYLGLWDGGTNKTIYKYYSYTFIFMLLILYNIQQTISLIYTPRKVEIMIKEVTFYFNVVAITINVVMIMIHKKTIVEVLVTLDSEEFQGTDDITNEIIKKDMAKYKIYWKGLMGLGNFAYIMKDIVPIIANFAISSYQISLPTFNYFFLNETTKNDYFSWLFAYEIVAIYAVMLYDVTSDIFMNGILFYSITQMKILNYRLRNLKAEINVELSTEDQEIIHVMELNKCLRHYDSILKYCSDIQSITRVIMFVKYGLGSTIICVLLCGLLLSQELVFAAYNSDWIPRTEPFKRSIKVFMERAKTPIVMVGLKLFPLSLETFTSVSLLQKYF
ncbi:unnamed protein product [Euphydryas editha]|uniref:Odorant receptor n=1 Tax=Euphydryas editha TaxID=104508 RepID=A0AAU9UXG5_EUPED|nr:unnamed protein product [Euphydryas editha]